MRRWHLLNIGRNVVRCPVFVVPLPGIGQDLPEKASIFSGDRPQRLLAEGERLAPELADEDGEDDQ